ncbi:MAG: hypothetical protein ABI689_03270 [Thermoanaerobaculia bacterium]
MARGKSKRTRGHSQPRRPARARDSERRCEVVDRADTERIDNEFGDGTRAGV